MKTPYQTINRTINKTINQSVSNVMSEWINEKTFWMIMGLSLMVILMFFAPEVLAKKASDLTKADELKGLFEWANDGLGYGLILAGGIAVLNAAYQLGLQQDLRKGATSAVAAVLAGGLGGKITLSATLLLM